MIALVLLAYSSAAAQSWAEKMFIHAKKSSSEDGLEKKARSKDRFHDFGTVGRGSQAIHKFAVKNIYHDTVHLARVHSSCKCTTPAIENPTLEAGAIGYIVAQLNTESSTGPQSATLTVTIDRPFRAQVQLHVQGTIHADLVLSPSTVQFGTITQGTSSSRKVTVTHTRDPDWRITNVILANNQTYIDVDVTETVRQEDRVVYDFLIHLKSNAPAGLLSDQLLLQTNESHQKGDVTLSVEGRIVPEISIRPNPLVFGEISQGDSSRKKIVIQSQKPFKITKIECQQNLCSFLHDNESRELHIVEVTFHAGSTSPGRLKIPIHIRTDQGQNIVGELTAYAMIVPADQ